MRALLAVVVVALLAAGCGSSGDGSKRSAPTKGTLEAIWRQAGPAVALVPGTSDYAHGDVRVSFLVVNGQGRSIERPTARVWVAKARSAVPFREATARLERVSVAGADVHADDAKSIYVVRLKLALPGRYWLVARPVGGMPIGGIRDLDVKARSASPSIGARAIPSRTPTLASAHGRVAALTTRQPPDRELLRESVAGALAARRPFVLVFATPAFCESRTCGPVVDVVEAARRRFADSGIRFIHVEIYRGNKPSNGVNRWVKEWRIPTEPWTFLVGRDGRIAAKFEGSMSLHELRSAIRAHLT